MTQELVPEDVTQALAIDDSNLFTEIRRGLATIDTLRENTDDPIHLSQTMALLDGLNRDLATLRKSVNRDLAARMTERKLEVPGVGVVERFAGSEWSQKDWDREAIGDALVGKVLASHEEGGLVDFGIEVFKATLGLVSSPTFKSTVLSELFDDLGDVGERKDKPATVKVPRLKGT